MPVIRDAGATRPLIIGILIIINSRSACKVWFVAYLLKLVIDPAGNVWAANTWNNLDAVASLDQIDSTSTWGGGSGFTVINGVTAQVKPPLMGQVRKY